MDKQENAPVLKLLKIIVIVLSALLVLSVCGLAARYIYLKTSDSEKGASESVGNVIGDESPDSSNTNPEGPRLELYKRNPNDNQRLEIENLLPGDEEIKYFYVNASYKKDIDLFFRADIVNQTNNLGDVLRVKVTRIGTGQVLCDDVFSNIDGKEFSEFLEADEPTAVVACYQVIFSLDSDAGNEYQKAGLTADFEWYVNAEDALIPPQQSGDVWTTVLVVVVAVLCLLVIVALGVWRIKGGWGENEKNERTK